MNNAQREHAQSGPPPQSAYEPRPRSLPPRRRPSSRARIGRFRARSLSPPALARGDNLTAQLSARPASALGTRRAYWPSGAVGHRPFDGGQERTAGGLPCPPSGLGSRLGCAAGRGRRRRRRRLRQQRGKRRGGAAEKEGREKGERGKREARPQPQPHLREQEPWDCQEALLLSASQHFRG
uniref:guanine nucleotide-binding protein G(I)/G(S)/G(O) subunit gamma-7 isoform X2 n=1 Tax=Podarcis muralis TaxID=64176 RepID=UPI0010A01865|nr:guanine nucleotide-binding protein G(I)/G(S)/G(O) subunit gamma-7 isoform X2 [Podarcis muralis]